MISASCDFGPSELGLFGGDLGLFHGDLGLFRGDLGLFRGEFSHNTKLFSLWYQAEPCPLALLWHHVSSLQLL